MDTGAKLHIGRLGSPNAHTRGHALERLSSRSKEALAIAGVTSQQSTVSKGERVKMGGPSLIQKMTAFFAGWKRPQAKIQLTGNVASSRNLTPSIPKPGTIPEALPLPSVYELQSENQHLHGQLSALSGDYKTLSAAFEFFKSNPSAQIQNAAARQAATILAGTGCRPLPTGAGDLENGDKIMARTSFSRLSPQAKSDFMRNGGKLTD